MKRSELINSIAIRLRMIKEFDVFIDTSIYEADLLLREIEQYMVPNDRKTCHCDECGYEPDNTWEWEPNK